MLFRSAGGVVRLRGVKIGRNYGESMELIEGVTAKDQLVLNPSDSLAEGDRVTVVMDKPATKGAAPAKAGTDTKEKS